MSPHLQLETVEFFNCCQTSNQKLVISDFVYMSLNTSKVEYLFKKAY